MPISNRLDQAIQKLYQAFHQNTLHPECCKSCAVGTILDNTDGWKHLSDGHGHLHLNYIGRVNELCGKRFNGYTPSELLQIEAAFLKGCGYALPLGRKQPIDPLDKDIQFDGLCAAISLLCSLDRVENVMDYTRLFRQELDQHTERKAVITAI
ncbi:Na(+)-translocating NADH-quinone reductase subunit F [Croceiramulus getboli]|nr:Na(+)-translocating NADH-quinone reductase subunit F [Flavobacteriaceae bacterium YJPT1-3]